MSRVTTFGVLLFTFATTMLGYVVKGTGTLSAGWYRTLGVAALVIAVFFLALAARKKWADFGEWLLNSWMYPIWMVIYFGLYIISFLKGYVGVVQAKQPDWIQYSVFFVGYAAMFYIAFMAFVKWPKPVRKQVKTIPDSKVEPDIETKN